MKKTRGAKAKPFDGTERRMIDLMRRAEKRQEEAAEELRAARRAMVRTLLNGRTMDEVGAALGVSRQRVSQLANR